MGSFARCFAAWIERSHECERGTQECARHACYTRSLWFKSPGRRQQCCWSCWRPRSTASGCGSEECGGSSWLEKGSGFSPPALGAPGQRVRLGSAAPGQSDPPAAAARTGARLRILGILRLRAGHHQSFRRRFHVQLFSRDGSFGRFYFTLAAVFAVAVAVSHRRTRLPAIRDPSEMAGAGLVSSPA